jgi:hypothetical protein
MCRRDIAKAQATQIASAALIEVEVAGARFAGVREPAFEAFEFGGQHRRAFDRRALGR